MAIDIGGMLARSGAVTGQLMGQGLANLGTGIGAGLGGMLTRRREREQKLKEKGIFGGTRAVQQAAQSGQLTPEMLNSYIGSMEGLGVPYDKLLGQINSLQETNTNAKQKARTGNFISSLGEEYTTQYEAGVATPKELHTQFLKDKQQQSIADLAVSLDPSLDPQVAQQMTSSDLVSLYEDKKEEGGAAAWAEWQRDNPQINNENRQQAIDVAVRAFGKDAPKTVADLEAKQLSIRSEREGDKSVPVLITMKNTAAFGEFDALGGGKTQITVKKLPVNPDGKLSPAAEKWLEAHAESAMVQDTGEPWVKTKTSDSNSTILGGDTSTPSGQGGEDSTLGQVIGPQALTAALEQIGDFN